MTLFPWKAEYGLGITEIDDQHKRFFELINDIEALLDRPILAPADLVEVISHLGDYAFYHFDTEEQHFKEFEYPEAAPHITSHQKFREQVQGFMEKARKPETDGKTLAHALAQFANDWLVIHILSVDRMYVPCFKEHGLK